MSKLIFICEKHLRIDIDYFFGGFLFVCFDVFFVFVFGDTMKTRTNSNSSFNSLYVFD
jgi:NADH:ubiquinone oxidoreductase subunit 3 (subunit A)